MMTKLLWLLCSSFICSACTQVSFFFFALLDVEKLFFFNSHSVPSTTQYLVVSPMIPKYTIHNTYLNTSTTVTTLNYDARSVQKTIPAGASAYVKSVTINGKVSPSRCHFDFYDVFRLGGQVIIELTSDKASVDDCGASVPESISTGGFSSPR
jgi:Glycosyl hydrolase family 92